MSKKRVLVYPCGTEIGLEIYRSVSHSIHYELVGGSSTYDHGRFVYKQHIDNLPFITDESTSNDIVEFNRILIENDIDFLYPAMDGVLYKFSEFRNLISCEVICPSFDTAKITRSKKETYEFFEGIINTPRLYAQEEVNPSLYPLFVKPDVGQGSVGTARINSDMDLMQYYQTSCSKMLLMEYLPGEEYTVDCFTNNEGRLVYVGGRGRKRIKNGISVNSVGVDDQEFYNIAQIINSKIKQRGGWFFQVKKDLNGNYSLLEIASRIAGASAYTRSLGVNLPLMTLFIYSGQDIESVLKNDYTIELDRALYNSFRLELDYRYVYVDYDDTIIIDGNINTTLVSYLYQCLNNGIKIILITKHDGDLKTDLQKYRIYELFDEIIHINKSEEKYLYITNKDAIFIDDSYGEREKVKNHCEINVFDPHMIEVLIE